MIDKKYIDINDKPFVEFPAYIMRPMESYFDEQAKAIRDKVLGFEDRLPASVTGTIWYISNSGEDSNSGNAPDNAWATIAAITNNSDKIKSGDAVLFERGGVYRGVFVTKSGVYYGAYGTGDKPCLYASPQNFVNALWESAEEDIWTVEVPDTKDVGSIFFNHGEAVGFKKLERTYVKEYGDFWFDEDGGNKLYLKHKGNPSEKYKSIEIGINRTIISVLDSIDVTIENLCLKYSGSHAVASCGAAARVSVRGCEIGFIGGGMLGDTMRYGNAIEFYSGCSDMLAENNWIYQIYDTGVSIQGDGVYENISFQNNLIEYCGMGSLEYWLSGEWNVNHCKRFDFSNNVCRFAGYCWGGEQRPDKCSSHIRSDTTCRNTIFGYEIKNNIFDWATDYLFEVGGTCLSAYERYDSQPDEEMKMPQKPTINAINNIYAQKKGDLFGEWFSEKGIVFDESIAGFIEEFVGDKTAKIFIYQ